MQASVLFAQGSMPTVQELGEPQIKDDRRGSHATDGSSGESMESPRDALRFLIMNSFNGIGSCL